MRRVRARPQRRLYSIQPVAYYDANDKYKSDNFQLVISTPGLVRCRIPKGTEIHVPYREPVIAGRAYTVNVSAVLPGSPKDPAGVRWGDEYKRARLSEVFFIEGEDVVAEWAMQANIYWEGTWNRNSY